MSELWVVRPETDRPSGLGPGAETVVFDGDLGDLHLELCARGPVEEIVDAARRGGLVGRTRLLVTHVRPGGRLVVLLPDEDSPHARPRARLLDLVDQVVALRASGDLAPSRVEETDVRPGEVRDLHALATSVTGVELTAWRGHQAVVWLVGGPRVLATVPEGDWAALLRRRPGVGSTLLEVPGEPTPQRGAFEGSDPADTAFQGPAPALSVRSFPQARCAPRQVAVEAVAADLVLPSSFRHPQRTRPRIRSLVDWAPRAVLAPHELLVADLPHLAGPHLHLDNVERGHFGHALTEQLSLTWAWPDVRRLRPDARVLVGATADRPVAAWELDLLEAAGIARDDVVVAPGPVVVEELLTATPGYVIGGYVHPRLLATWDVVGEHLAATASPGPRPERVFLTRPPGRRSCVEAEEVEALATAHGFTLLRPETLGLAEQVATVRAADAVAGYAGSAMFHLALTDRPVPVVVVAPSAYHAANERQICAARGHDLHLVRGASEVVGSSRRDETMHADYALGPPGIAWLQKRLAGLAG